jgi:hypothetical protein
MIRPQLASADPGAARVTEPRAPAAPSRTLAEQGSLDKVRGADGLSDAVRIAECCRALRHTWQAECAGGRQHARPKARTLTRTVTNLVAPSPSLTMSWASCSGGRQSQRTAYSARLARTSWHRSVSAAWKPKKRGLAVEVIAAARVSRHQTSRQVARLTIRMRMAVSQHHERVVGGHVAVDGDGVEGALRRVPDGPRATVILPGGQPAATRRAHRSAASRQSGEIRQSVTTTPSMVACAQATRISAACLRPASRAARGGRAPCSGGSFRRPWPCPAGCSAAAARCERAGRQACEVRRRARRARPTASQHLLTAGPSAGSSRVSERSLGYVSVVMMASAAARQPGTCGLSSLAASLMPALHRAERRAGVCEPKGRLSWRGSELGPNLLHVEEGANHTGGQNERVLDACEGGRREPISSCRAAAAPSGSKRTDRRGDRGSFERVLHTLLACVRFVKPRPGHAGRGSAPVHALAQPLLMTTPCTAFGFACEGRA